MYDKRKMLKNISPKSSKTLFEFKFNFWLGCREEGQEGSQGESEEREGKRACEGEGSQEEREKGEEEGG